MQFLLIGIRSVCKGSKYLSFFSILSFFQVWSIKQILTLFLLSASADYRVNWINSEAISVCVCVCVVCV